MMNLEQLKVTIQTVVDYNWDDEAEDYRLTVMDGDDPGDMHIFHALVRLQNWLDGAEMSPKEYIEDGAGGRF